MLLTATKIEISFYRQMISAKSDIIQQLQKEVLALQGFRSIPADQQARITLGPIETAFPGHAFPIGAVHEFLSVRQEDAAATTGFISAILGQLMQKGICLWISTRHSAFAPALKNFGIEPEKIVFIDLHNEKQALWAIEEALKCESLAAVVGELREISFMESRRLQLAVEKSRVTGFIHRYQPRAENAVAAVSRWKITPVTSEMEEGMPGIGFSCWNVQLLKVRSGRPSVWEIECSAGRFRYITTRRSPTLEITMQKTG